MTDFRLYDMYLLLSIDRNDLKTQHYNHSISGFIYLK